MSQHHLWSLFLLLSSLLVLPPRLQAQSPLTCTFDSYSELGLTRWDRLPLMVLHAECRARFVLPEEVNPTEAAWGLLQMGTEQPDTLYLLVEDYASETPTFYLDQDQDGDFTEEEPHPWNPGRGPLRLNLNAVRQPSLPHWIHLQPSEKLSEEEYQFAFQMLAPPFQEVGLEVLPPKHWWVGQRQATRLGELVWDSLKVAVAVYDANFNGRFDDMGEDIVWVGPPESEPRFSRSGGAATVGTDPLLRVGQAVFRVDSLSPTGSFLRLAPSNEPYPYLYRGDQLPGLVLERLDQGEDSLRSLLHPQELTLFTTWGSWCKGCAAQRPYLLELMHQQTDQLHVVGLVKDDPSAAAEYARQHQLPWDNWLLTPSLEEALMISHYPSYWLVSPEGIILQQDVELEEVRQFLEEGG